MIGYCIGVIYDTAKNIVGYRVLFLSDLVSDVTNIQTKVINITAKDMYNELKSRPQAVQNLKIENGKVAGKGGALTRYAIISVADMQPKTQSITILAEAYSHNNAFLGYLCADACGNIREFNEDTVVKLSSQMPVANGKVVNHYGKQKVAAIEGAYNVYTKPKAKVTRKKSTPTTVQTEAKNDNHMASAPTNTKIEVQPIKNENIEKSPDTSCRHIDKVNNDSTKQVDSGEKQETIGKQNPETARSQSADSQAQIVKNDETPEKVESYDEPKVDPSTGSSTNVDAQLETPKEETKTIRRKRTDDEMAEERLNKARVITIELMKFDKYRWSYAHKIVNTISKSKPTRCSEKQYKVLYDSYQKWIADGEKLIDGKRLIPNPDIELEYFINVPCEQNDNNAINTQSSVKSETKPVEQPKVVENQPKPVESTTVKEEPKDVSEPEPGYEEIKLPTIPRATKANIAAALPVVTATEETEQGKFEYEIINNKMYITKFKDIETEDGHLGDPIDIVIPRKTIYNGKEYIITGIGHRAFARANVKTVKVGSNITDISQEAFAECTRMTAIDLSESSITLIPMGMCASCGRLEAVNIGSNVERIHEKAFYYCKSLKSVNAGRVDTIAADAFRDCVSLSIFTGKPKTINDSAFRNCVELKEFDFSETVSIGTMAFRGAGFSSLTIPGNTLRVGKKAFADCLRLENVCISEGVLEIGEYCFSKSKRSCDEVLRDIGRMRLTGEFKEIEAINTPKSVETIGTNPFMHVKIVYGYTGTVCESSCLTHSIVFMNKDAVNKENATVVRVRSTIMGIKALKFVYNDYMRIKNNELGTVKVEINPDKLVSIELKPDVMEFLHITKTTEVKEPNSKFVGALNLVKDLVNIYAVPLCNKLISLRDAYYVSHEVVYDDGCNKLLKVKYTMKDTLLSGTYWAFIMDNKLVYSAEFTKQTNIKMRPEIPECNVIALDRHLHTGDKIGYDSAFDGSSGIYEDEVDGRRIRADVGELVQRTLDTLGVIIDVTNGRRFIYVPSATTDKKAVELVDSTQSLNAEQKKRYAAKYKGNDDPLPIGSYSIKRMLTYDELLDALKEESAKSEDIKFFNELARMSQDEINTKLVGMNTIGVEMEAQLFRVSKEFNQVLAKNSVKDENVSPSLMPENVFIGLTQSYFMVEQDERWFKSVQTKSLNKTHEYSIGNYTVTEMKSNQVIKFSNPYMSGRKGAYVFVLVKGRVTCGIYASRYNLEEMAKMLHNMTYIPSYIDMSKVGPLMTNAKKLDAVDPALFYHFFPVLNHSDDWKILDRVRATGHEEYRLLYNMSVAFNLSMYKPTGVFYLTMTKYVKTGKDEMRKRVIPIVPIGNMDRALIVAETTNANNAKSNFLTDMIGLCVAEEFVAAGKVVPDRLVGDVNINGYYMARQLIINKDRTMEKYRGLVSDRVLYMLGVLHSGKLIREGEAVEEDDDDFDLDFGDDEDIDDALDDEDIDFGDDDDEYDEYFDTDEDDEEEDDEEDEKYSDEDIEYILSVDADTAGFPADKIASIKSLQSILRPMTPEQRKHFLNNGLTGGTE